jgi:hypothetical protein
LVVRDLDALKARACLCNESVTSHFDTVLRGVYPHDDVTEVERSAVA